MRTVLAAKQKKTLEALTAMGGKFPAKSRSTFYLYGDVSGLPAPINTGMGFMNEAFKHQVLTMRGVLRSESGQAAYR